MSHELRQRKLVGTIDVASGALAASERMTRCAVSAKSLRARGIETDTTFDASPQSIGIAELQRAGLVLASDQRVCAEIIRMLPTVRSRLFTIREGAALAASLTSQWPPGQQDNSLFREQDGDAGDSCEGRIHETSGRAGRLDTQSFVAEMDARRGRIPRPVYARGIFGRRRRVTPAYDIVDVHGGSARQHRHMINEMSTAISTLMSRW